MLNKDVVVKIAKLYGLEVLSLSSPQKGYRNQSWPIKLKNGLTVNIILYKTEPGILIKIKNANFVSNQLSFNNFNTRYTLDNRIVQIKTNKIVKYASIYNYLEGNTIPWDAYSMKHLKLLGETLGNVHECLKKLKNSSMDSVIDEYINNLNYMEVYFCNSKVLKALIVKTGISINKKKISQYKKLLLTINKQEGCQPLHMDFVRSNILFKYNERNNLEISGILDFEKVAIGPPVFDIARTLAFLLVDCKHKTEEKILKYFLASGYIKRGIGSQQISMPELIEPLTSLFLFYDFYKFLIHNPYEFLYNNEHFMRTVAQLSKRDIITTDKNVALSVEYR